MTALEIPAPTVPGATMYALVSDQGTAMSETALCASCYAVSANQGYAEDQGRMADDWDRNGWHNCTGNDALLCVVCGRDDEGTLAPDVDADV